MLDRLLLMPSWSMLHSRVWAVGWPAASGARALERTAPTVLRGCVHVQTIALESFLAAAGEHLSPPGARSA